MKKYLVLLICLTVSFIAFGQNEMKNVMVDAEVEVTAPQFTGIENVAVLTNADKTLLIKEYLVENANYPRNAAKCMREGTEVIQFTITVTGELTNFKVINSVCSEIDNEVIRVLKTTNRMWRPGFNNGVPIAMQKEVSMVFKSGDYSNITKHFTEKATTYFNRGNKKLYLKNNPQKALKCYNEGMRYLPYDKGLLYVRGMCLYEMGDVDGAKKDWNRIVSLGGIDFGDTIDFVHNSSKMKGYSEMAEILKK